MVSPSTFYALLVAAIPLLILGYRKRKRTWVDVPVVGFSDPILSYYSAFQNILMSKSMLAAGYSRNPRGMFRAPEIGGWQVYICGPVLVEEICKLPDEILDIQEAAKITLQGDYTFSPAIFSNGYHIPIIRHNLTRALPELFPAVLDELRSSFEDYLPKSSSPDRQITVKALDTVMRMICRASNRTFVGLPLARNKDYMDVMCKYTIDVVLGAHIVSIFPRFLRPLAAKFATTTRLRYNAAKRLTFPLIQERYSKLAEHDGDWGCLPNDMLTWHMQNAEGIETTAESLTYRVLMLNFVSLHTTSMVNTWVLLYLAAYPEYVHELREEIEIVLQEWDWTTTAMGNLRKLDSFIKEVMRLRPVIGATITRFALKDFTLSNGIFIPAGTKIATAADPQHLDTVIFGDNANNFDGMRFYDRHKLSEVNQQLATSTSEYVVFGYGRHVCPGRHFAVNEMKALISLVLMNYDINFANPKIKLGHVPDAIWVGSMCALDPSLELTFKCRQPNDCYIYLNVDEYTR